MIVDATESQRVGSTLLLVIYTVIVDKARTKDFLQMM